MAARKAKAPPAEVERAKKVLAQAQGSVAGFLTAFSTVRAARGAHGNPTNEEQDLLRAALVFAAAGLDAVVKELIKGALRTLATIDADVQAELETFVQRQLRGESEEPDAIGGRKFLAKVLLAPTPQDRLVEEYVVELTGSSLQNAKQLCKAAKALGLEPTSAGVNPSELRPIFDARNDIIHELDVNLEKTAARRSQNSRSKPQMEEWSNKLLSIAQKLVELVSTKLASTA